jgi:hypothetical protein
LEVTKNKEIKAKESGERLIFSIAHHQNSSLSYTVMLVLPGIVSVNKVIPTVGKPQAVQSLGWLLPLPFCLFLMR